MKLKLTSLTIPIFMLILLLSLLSLTIFNLINHHAHLMVIFITIIFCILQYLSIYFIEYEIKYKIKTNDNKIIEVKLYDNGTSFYFKNINRLYFFNDRRLSKIKYIEIIDVFNFNKKFIRLVIDPYKYIWWKAKDKI